MKIKDIAKALLSDFFLTQQKSGTSAGFTSSKIKTFTNLVKEMLDEICNVINHKLIPDLIKMNLMDNTLCPELTHTEISDLDLTNIMLLFQSYEKGPFPVTLEMSNFLAKQMFGNNTPEFTQEDIDNMLLQRNVTTVSNDDGTLAKEEAQSTQTNGENK